MTATMIFHLCRTDDWVAAQRVGDYAGSAQDRADGFLHFSTAAQIAASAARHRAGETGLTLLAVDPAQLGTALRWEPSRGGALFPHLYGTLPVALVVWARPLPLGVDGRHCFPDLETGAAG